MPSLRQDAASIFPSRANAKIAYRPSSQSRHSGYSGGAVVEGRGAWTGDRIYPGQVSRSVPTLARCWAEAFPCCRFAPVAVFPSVPPNPIPTTPLSRLQHHLRVPLRQRLLIEDMPMLYPAVRAHYRQRHPHLVRPEPPGRDRLGQRLPRKAVLDSPERNNAMALRLASAAHAVREPLLVTAARFSHPMHRPQVGDPLPRRAPSRSSFIEHPFDKPTPFRCMCLYVGLTQKGAGEITHPRLSCPGRGLAVTWG